MQGTASALLIVKNADNLNVNSLAKVTKWAAVLLCLDRPYD